MQSSMTAQLVMDALLMAILRRGRPEAVLHHSDQGSQYTSDVFHDYWNRIGIACSMSRRGNCWNNAAMESFFSTLKTERLAAGSIPPVTNCELTSSITLKGSTTQNAGRSTIGYISPVQFENLQCA